MLKRVLVFVACLTAIGAATALAPTDSTSYRPVPDWLHLPETMKLGQVTAVATNAADQVFIFHRGRNPILVLDAEGKYLRSWGDGLIENAHGLRLDRDENVWITDLARHQVMKFDSQGKLLLTLGRKGEPGETPTQFNKPADVAFGPAGEIYVADGYGNSRVVKFKSDGTYVKAWGKRGKAAGEFNLPHAARVDAQNRLLVGDRENDRVQIFDLDGRFLTQWQQTGAPFGLELTRDGRVLLTDGRANVAKILDLEGKTLQKWGEKGKAPGQFIMPHAVCIDSRGVVYVAEVTGQRLQKFVTR